VFWPKSTRPKVDIKDLANGNKGHVSDANLEYAQPLVISTEKGLSRSFGDRSFYTRHWR
jgi:hypothetical protein